MKKEIREVWESLGRDPNKLRISHMETEELKQTLTRLKAIKYSFDLLFSPNPGVELAKEMLKVTFKSK